MKHILKRLNQRPIAYYPVYRQITGSTTAGILLSQLMYWFTKQDKIYKIDTEIMEETFLTAKELKTAKSKIKELSFITVNREGLPAKTFYEIDWNMYKTCLSDLVKLDGPKGTNSMVRKGQTRWSERDKHYIDTENTTENTTENKKDKKEISLPDELNIEAYNFWCEYKGKSYSKQGKTLSINKLIQYSKDVQQQMVDNSIMNNYKGLFEVKAATAQISTQAEPQQNHKTVAKVLIEYVQDRQKGFSQEVATLQAKEKLNWGMHKDLDKVIQDKEYEWYMQRRERQQQTQPQEDDDDYVKRVMGEL